MNIKILQLIEEKEHRFLFLPWLKVENDFDLDNYAEVWSGTNDDIGISTPSTNDQWNLYEIFQIFNINRPENFTGHSLTVSDIVIIDDVYYYCDSFGWQKID